MLALLLEGLESAWLPCSLILLVPGAAAVLAGRDEVLPAAIAFGGSSLVLSWLRFSDRGGDWPIAVAAVLLIGASVLFTVSADHRERVSAIGAGVLAGAASAELWEPCVGSEFGQLLNQLPDRGVDGLVFLTPYVLGLLSPLAGIVAIIKLFPRWLLEPIQGALAIFGAAVLAVMAVATAMGLHDDVVGRLILWSL